MKVYTQKEFDAIERDEYGYKNCPTGDYTQIKSFPELCRFGERCRFGEGCRFGMSCSFGEDCSFGEGCGFGEESSFGEDCNFGEWCSFGEGCGFGRRCRFGEWCSFGEFCRFGERCSFEADRVINGAYFACDRIGSEKRKTYFFKGDNGCFVRAGCYFGTFDEFAVKVKERHGGTKFEREYLAALELAKIVLEVE